MAIMVRGEERKREWLGVREREKGRKKGRLCPWRRWTEWSWEESGKWGKGTGREREDESDLATWQAPIGPFKYLFKILNLPPILLNF